jgi:hypothetical protein
MTITVLGTALASAAAALSLLAPTAPKVVTPSDVVYCVDAYTIGQHPDCVAPPTPSIDYRGVPVAVGDKKQVDVFTKVASINLLKNDAIQKKDHKKTKIKLSWLKPEMTGVKAWIGKGKKIYFQSLPGRVDGNYLPYGGVTVRYQVIDYKGRTSAPAFIELRVLPKGCGKAGTC